MGVPPRSGNTTSEGMQMNGYSRTWVGWIFFAASMMILMGFFQALMGVAALVDDSYFRVKHDDLLLPMDFVAWGWLHIGIGVVAVVTGFAVMLAQKWARVIAVVMAVVSLFTNVAYVEAYPLWSVAIIALDVIAVYALIVHGDEIEDAAFDDA
jgi:hypothetical protein